MSTPAAGPPELIDHPQYEFVRELGRGGMGVVYLVRNRMLERLEVLKVVNKELLAKPGASERFLQEMRAAAKLSHPNLVAAYTALSLGDSLAFAMEYVDGRDLSEVVKGSGPVPVRTACQFIRMAALGLQHAYEKGMVHRDIKPSNLMLARTGEKGEKQTVKILDFGLAKASSEKELDTGLTGSGRMLGTPDYMSPEQVLDAASAKTPADIYSLGGTLYYLLAGHTPFRDVKSLAELLDAHRYRDPVAIDELRSDVPQELTAVLARMMAKDPAARYQQPREVFQALEPFVKPGAPVKPTTAAPVLAKAIPATRPTDASMSMPAVVADPLTFDEPTAKPERQRGSEKPTMPQVPLALVAGGGALAVLLLLTCGGLGLWAMGVFSSATPTALASNTTPTSKPDDTPPTHSTPSTSPTPLPIPVKPAARFVDRGEVVEDTKTGLLWQKDGKAAGLMNYYDAAGYAANLNLGGLTGWRLPTREEFHTIFPATEPPFTNTRYNPGVYGEGGKGEFASYWTSSGEAGMNNRAVLYTWYGRGGSNGCLASANLANVRCVLDPRGGPPRPPANPVPPAAGLNGFVPLFNGKDLTGWSQMNNPPQPGWAVTDGVLSQTGRFTGPLATKRKDFENFHLRAEVSAAAPTFLGLTVRTDPMWFQRVGYTVQLGNYPPNSLGLQTGSIRRNEAFGWDGVVARAMDLLDPPDRWFKIEVIADGGKITTLVDGKKTCEYDDPAPAPPGAISVFSPIPTAPLRFRSIEIKELPPTPPVAKVPLSPAAEKEFVPLLAGNGLVGWTPHPATPGDWTLVGGVLTGRTRGVIGSAGTVLYTDRDDYDDVHIRGEVLISDGAFGGVVARSTFGPSTGPFQLAWAPGGYTATVNANGPTLMKTGSVLISSPPRTNILGSQYMAAVPPIPADKWGKFEMIVLGSTIVTRVDGRDAISTSDLTRRHAKGRLALYVGGNSSQIQVRNLEVKRAVPIPIPQLVADEPKPRWAPGADGFTPLFNGKDTTDWELPPTGKWAVQDGVLTGSPAINATMLRYTKPLPVNFQLRAEIVATDAVKAGAILFRTSKFAQGERALEVMAGSATDRPGDLSGVNILRSGAVMVSPARLGYAAGGVTAYEITVRGQRVKCVINGELAYEREVPAVYAAGTGLALISYSDSRLRVLSLGVKELPAE